MIHSINALAGIHTAVLTLSIKFHSARGIESSFTFAVVAWE